MIRLRLFALVLALCAVAASAQELTVCVVLDIDGVGWERLAELQSLPGTEWWLELDRELAVCGSDQLLHATTGGAVLRWVRDLDPLRLRLARGFTDVALVELGADVVARGGGFALLYFAGPAPPAVMDPDDGGDGRDWRQLLAVPHDGALVRQEANRRRGGSVDFFEDVGILVDQVNAQRWFDDIVTLASFNRYTLAPDILNARDWVVTQLEAMPGLSVTTSSFQVQGVTAYNVIATLQGTVRPDDWYVIGGHYDATSEDPYTAAPGAEDNASGCAGVLEMARILSAVPLESTVMFICYAGEEQGLYGSVDHVADLVATGDADKVQVMLDMDMIGYTVDADLDCLLETEGFASFLLDLFSDAATTYTDLTIVASTWAWGSDHVPYLDAGIPALLTIENDWSSYPDYHRTTDVPANITLDMGEQILRMNVAAMAQMIGSDSGLLFSDGFESGDISAWASP